MTPDSQPVLPKIVHLLPVAASGANGDGTIARIVGQLAQAQKLALGHEVEIWCLHTDDLPTLLPDNITAPMPCDHFVVADSWGTLSTALQVALEACGTNTIFHWHEPALTLDMALLSWHLKRQKHSMYASFYQPQRQNFLAAFWWRLLGLKQHNVFEDVAINNPAATFIPCLMPAQPLDTAMNTGQSPTLYKPQTPIFLCPIANEPWLQGVLLPALQHYWAQAGAGAQGALWLYDTGAHENTFEKWQKFLYKYQLQQRVRVWPTPHTSQALAMLADQADMVIVPQLTNHTTDLLDVLAHNPKKLALPAQSWLGQQWPNTSSCVADDAWLTLLPQVAQAVQTHQDNFIIDNASQQLQQWQTPQHYATQIDKLLYHDDAA